VTGTVNQKMYNRFIGWVIVAKEAISR